MAGPVCNGIGEGSRKADAENAARIQSICGLRALPEFAQAPGAQMQLSADDVRICQRDIS
jgi:hypothetical protein